MSFQLQCLMMLIRRYALLLTADSTTIFVFSANADREEVLDTFDKTTLRLHHEIWSLQNDDLSEDLEYKIFIP